MKFESVWENENKSGFFRQMILLSFAVSFIGWSFEKIGRYFVYNSVTDRGFLTMPICPIYGFSVLAIYFIMGTPQSPTLNFKSEERNIYFGLPIYFISAAFVATALELVTGFFFDKVVGVRLWDYSAQAISVGPYICLKYSLLWGFMITLFMATVWEMILKLAKRIPMALTKTLSIVIAVAVCADLTFNMIYICKFGTHFNFL